MIFDDNDTSDMDRSQETAIDLSAGELTLDHAEDLVTQADVRAAVRVVLNGKTLIKDTDYTVSSRFLLAGDGLKIAQVTVTGIGSYTGTIEGEFELIPSISTASYDKVADAVYTGKAITPKPVLRYKAEQLEENRDYTLSWANNTNPGEAKIIVTGIGRFNGRLEIPFRIVGISITPARVSIASTGRITDLNALQSLLRVTLNGTVLENGTDYTWNASWETLAQGRGIDVKITGKGNYTGNLRILFSDTGAFIEDRGPRQDASSPGTQVETQVMYRLYNPNSGEHFYTASEHEKNELDRIGWNYEGTGWIAPKISTVPVYRLYNPNAGDHHYTTSSSERAALIRVGWKDEGIGWYSSKTQEVPLYRLYNPHAKQAGAHHYTTKTNERDALVRLGWKAEGIGWYGMN